MQTEIKNHHRKLNNALQSIKVMLANKRHTLDNENWQLFIDKTKQAIITNPNQYLDTELPTQETLKAVVDRIFQQFIDDQKMR